MMENRTERDLLNRAKEMSGWRSRKSIRKRAESPRNGGALEVTGEGSWIESTVRIIRIRTFSGSQE